MEEEVGYQLSQLSMDVSVASIGVFLPDEIFSEILSWLPAKQLVRCKCVCKQWYKLIEDRSFALQHFSHSYPATIYCPHRVEFLEVDGRIVREKYRIILVFVGLILERSEFSLNYRVRNLTTQEIIYLPNPHEDTFLINHGYNSSRDIKLVSVYGNKDIKGFEILNLDDPRNGEDYRWRRLNFPFPILEKHLPGLYGIKLSNFDTTVYRVKRDHYGSNGRVEVRSLDVMSERFFNNTLPTGSFSDLSKVMAFIWNGCQAFGEIKEDKLNVIVLEDYRMHKWSETKIVIPLTFLKEKPDLKNLLVPTSFRDLSKLWFRSKQVGYDRIIYVYDIESKIFTSVDLTGSEVYCTRPSVITFKRNATGGGTGRQ